MFLTVFDTTSGSYYSYSIQRDVKDSTHGDSMDEDLSGSEYNIHRHYANKLFSQLLILLFFLLLFVGKSYFIDTSHDEGITEYTMALKYSYCSTTLSHVEETSDESEVLEGLRGVAHISAPLESEAMCLMLQSVKGDHRRATVPAALQSVLRLPLTLLLTSQGTLLVLIGAQVVKEVPLQWIDDLADDSEGSNSGEISGAGASSISTLHKDGVHLAVHFTVSTFLPHYFHFR